MKSLRTIGALLALSATTAMASNARAEGYALDRFDPAPAGDRLFGVQSPTTQGDLDVHLMLLTDYAHNPFVLTHNRGVADVGSVVEHQLFLHLNGSLALWDRLTVGVDVPVALVQDGSDAVYAGQTLAGAQDAAFGDLRFHLRGTLLELDDDVLQLGIGGYLWLPTGAADNWVSDGTVRGSLEVLLAGMGGPLYWNLSMGPQFRDSKSLIGIPQSSMFTWGAGAGVLLGDDQEVQLGPEVKISANLEDPQRRNTNIELLLGAKYRFLEDWELGVAAGPGLSEGIGTPDLRGLMMFAYSPDTREKAPTDTDGDGIPDTADACPEKAGMANDDATLHGCPVAPPPPDADVDGVPDDVDACPALAGVASDDPTKNGCPLDSDGDGISDDLDACPNEAVPLDKSDPQRPGCPQPDGDGDGIADSVDACPGIAGVASEDPTANGCPGDSDGDGFRDDQDACPKVKGKDDPDPAKRGCPTAVRLVGSELKILQQVQFATGTARIKAESNDLLEEVATVLKDHQELVAIEVQGHTDNQGPQALNEQLSQQRADAVMKSLVDRGVGADRLTAKGYGPNEPIADNGTDEGRAKNRRVQFKITKRKSD